MSRRTARTIRIFSLEVSLDLVLLDIRKSTFQHLTVNWKVTSSQNGLKTFLMDTLLENKSFYFRYLHIPLSISKTEKTWKGIKKVATSSTNEGKHKLWYCSRKHLLFCSFLRRNAWILIGKPRLWRFVWRILFRLGHFPENWSALFGKPRPRLSSCALVLEMVNGLCKYRE